MKILKYRLLEKGTGKKYGSPTNMAFLDKSDINEAGLSCQEAVKEVAKKENVPVAINVLDMDVLTTTSDGLVVEGAIVMFAAADKGKVHSEFGLLPIKKMEVTEEMITREPHALLAKKLYPGKPIYRGADYDIKNVPIHNSVMTGRTINNNSGTEIMDAVSMEELLIPILGQLEIMNDNEIILGITGEEISVGIGTTILEDYSRSQPYMKCSPGDTAHGSGKYAKTLKSELPILLAPKKVLARHIITALEEGFRPGKELAVSPAVLSVCHYMGMEFDPETVTVQAKTELEAINIDINKIGIDSPCLTAAEVIEKADEIIPGVREPELVDSKDVIKKKEIKL